LPAWYVDAQLYKFEQGFRGAHPDDTAGMRMRPMALALPGPEDMKRVAEHVAQLPKKKQKAWSVGGDPARGKVLFAPCVACHGPSGKGNAATKAPPLAGLQDWYLLKQLEHFKTGVRGADPNDTTGIQMKPFAETLDDQGMKDVVAYIATLPWYR
jgi:cytochrome c oxidase subunit 2